MDEARAEQSTYNKKTHIAVKGLIFNGDKMLILKRPQRAHEPHSYWELPGGGLDFGELPEQVLCREVMEEVQLEVEVIKPIWVWSFMKNPHTQVIGLTYICSTQQSIPKLSDEHLNYAWVTASELDDYPLLPQLRADLEAWQKKGILKF